LRQEPVKKINSNNKFEQKAENFEVNAKNNQIKAQNKPNPKSAQAKGSEKVDKTGKGDGKNKKDCVAF
jgi:hypothetical protein